ncbi:MAG: hypothetical protein ACYDAQ_13010, partial [Mycobacteriales bacterium]
VRPDVGAHVGRPAPSGLDAAALVPIRQVLELPPRPLALLAAALVFVAATVLVALVGVGAAARSSTVATNRTVVAGVPLGSGRTVQVNLAKPVQALFTALPAQATTATAVQLRLSVLGAAIASSDVAPLSRRGSGAGATVNISSGHYLVPGPLTASLRLLDTHGSLVGQEQFTLAPSGSGWATIPGGLALALLLFALAYLESLLRPLYRRGRLLVPSLIGVAVMGALTGAVVVALVWVAGVREPTIPTLIVSAGVGAVAAIALAVTLARAGLRARVRRLAHRRGIDVAPAPARATRAR